MPRKVFLSVLGTGNYSPCVYQGENSKTTTRYIQEATLNEINAASWTENDAVYIFLTGLAKSKNWSPADGSGLESTLKNLNLSCMVQGIDIDDGKNETEMWSIFNTVFELIKDGDDLYFDLTHGFRYLPMFMLVLGNYAKFLRNTRVAYMSYGNWEVGKNNGGIAPIMDMLPLAVLQDWTSSAFAFKTMGNVRTLTEAMKVYAFHTDNTLSKHIMALSNNLVKFESQIETCRGTEIIQGQVAEEVKNNIKAIEKLSLPKPIIEILREIKAEIQLFKRNSQNNIITALSWCKKFGLVQQGYTLCQEGIVTKVCEELSEFNPFLGDKSAKKYRDYWSAILGLKDNEAADESKWHGSLSTNRELTRSILALDWVARLRGKYNKLTSNRNTVNHGGFTGKITAETIVNQFEGIVKDCQECFDWELTPPTASKAADRPAIFINLSNHPADKWSEAQREAARQYGELQEIPFPNVEPEADAKALKKIVEETLIQIKEAAEGKTATVHVMGEMTLTYELVTKLKEVGIRCVASTTKRDVTENADGTRTCKFNFVKFREY